jgi:hypothetical protein
MKKIIRFVILPSLLFLFFGISAMILVSGCEREPGEKCSECVSNYDCNDGLSCYIFKNAYGVTSQRCAESAGDICLNLK